MTLVAGVDSSTQSTKVELRRIDTGEVVGVGRAGHPATTPPRSEQNPEAWWAALIDALDQVADRLADVVAIAVAGQQHGLVLLDDEGRALRPAKLWNDTESAPQSHRLIENAGADVWAQACGSVPAPAFTITKLAWVADHQPDLLDRVARIMLPHDYLTWRLSGQHVTDRGDASGSGWWSPFDDAYRTDLLDLVGLGHLAPHLPAVLGPTVPAGSVTADDSGLGPDVLVGPGTGDNMAGALGLGLRLGDLAVSIGTSGTAYAVSRTPTADQSGAVAGFADATGHFLPLVCTLNATKVTDAVARLLGVDHRQLDQLAREAPPGARGLTLVPYLDGERTPNRPDATGLLAGIGSDVERADLARAGFEGVACGLLDGVDALDRAGVALDGRFFLIGGGARAAGYQRAFADLAGRAVMVPTADETVATGACVQAAVISAIASGDDLNFSELATRWGLGAGPVVDPDLGVDRSSIRGAYRVAAGR